MTYEDISGPVAYKDILGPVTIENVIFWHPSYRSSKQRNERRTKCKRNWMRRILQAELLWVSDDQTGKLQPNRWECLFNSSSDLRCRVFQWIVVNPFNGFWRPLTVLILLWGDYFKDKFRGAQDEIRKLNQARGISCRCDHVWVISAAVIVQENSHLTATNEKLKLDCISLLTSNHSNCLGESVYSWSSMWLRKRRLESASQEDMIAWTSKLRVRSQEPRLKLGKPCWHFVETVS